MREQLEKTRGALKSPKTPNQKAKAPSPVVEDASPGDGNGLTVLGPVTPLKTKARHVEANGNGPFVNRRTGELVAVRAGKVAKRAKPKGKSPGAGNFRPGDLGGSASAGKKRQGNASTNRQVGQAKRVCAPSDVQAARKKNPAPVASAPHNPVASVGFSPVAPAALGDDGSFKMPEPWIESGRELVAPGSSGGRVLSVTVGVDFGTAFTKVAIRAGQQVYFVTWDGISLSQPAHLLAGQLSKITGDVIVVGQAPERDAYYCDLKLPLLRGDTESLRPQIPALCFLAWILKYTRAWAYRHPDLGPLLRSRRVAWNFNLGCPAKSWADEPIKRVYRQIGVCSWALSQRESITPDTAWRELAKKPRPAEEVGLDDLQLIAEFLAQIGGYVKSPQRQDGLHLLVDVGAGTLDVATFNVYKKSAEVESIFPIFSCDLYPRGTHYLMKNRADACSMPRNSWTDMQTAISPQELGERWGKSANLIDEADDQFRKLVRAGISKVLQETKSRRYRRAPEWREGLPVFLVGGGSAYPLYADGVTSACQAVGTNPKIIRIESASRDFSMHALEGTEFHRMSVAYGLTFDPEDLGRILPRSEVEDEVQPKPVERLTHEELYPKD